MATQGMLDLEYLACGSFYQRVACCPLNAIPASLLKAGLQVADTNSMGKHVRVRIRK